MGIIGFDLTRVSNFLVDIADNEIVGRYKQLRSKDIWKKSGNENVCTVDIQMQIKLGKILGDILPGSSLLSEELCKNPNDLSQYSKAELLWVLDPLDGTSNFIAGNKNCGVNLALIYHGEVVAAWIYAPFKRKLVEAELRGGIHLNKSPYVKRPSDKNEIMELSGILAIGDFPKNLQQNIYKVFNDLRSHHKTKACCIDYIDLLEGNVDFLLYLRTYPWDHCAGVFVLREANIFCESWIEKKKYNYLESYSGLLIAQNFILWNKIRNFFHLDSY